MAVAVTGVAELSRAFGKAGKHLTQDMKDALAEAAAPVRSDAQALAAARLRPGDPWAGMRVGVSRHTAWVAPRERADRGRSRVRSRPLFGDFLLNRAMIPALNKNIPKVEQRIERLLDEVFAVWERA